MPISMTFNRISPDLQDFQAWNLQVQISKTFQIFKAPYEPCLHLYCRPTTANRNLMPKMRSTVNCNIKMILPFLCNKIRSNGLAVDSALMKLSSLLTGSKS
jgi:hypothetical protein